MNSDAEPLFVQVANFVADLVYAVLDPRIRVNA